MKLFKNIFGRVYAAPEPDNDPDDTKRNDGNGPDYPDNLREGDGNEPIECVYAGPDFFARKRPPKNEPMGAVYAGPDYFASRNPTDGDPMSGVYAGPMGMGQGMGMGFTPPPVVDDGLPPQVMGIVPASIPFENKEEREANKVKCPGCGYRVPQGMKFCPECGSEIVCEPKCPECGSIVTKETKFCPECGRKLDCPEKKEDA